MTIQTSLYTEQEKARELLIAGFVLLCAVPSAAVHGLALSLNDYTYAILRPTPTKS